MSFLATLRLTGSLEVKGSDREVSLIYRGGRIDGADARGTLDEGELLARLPGIDPGLRRQLLEGAATGTSLATRLADADATQEVAQRILVEQILVVLAAVPEWQDAGFVFHHDVELAESPFALGLEVQELLLETARRCDEWGRLPEIYGIPGTRFEMIAEPGKDDEKISLGLQEWKILYLVSNRASVAEIQEASGLESDFETSHILFTLASAGLIRPLKAAAEPEDEAPVGFTGAIRLDQIEMPSAPGSVGTAGETAAAEPVPDSTARRPAVRLERGEPVSRAPERGEDTGTLLTNLSGIRRLTRHQIRVRRQGRLRRIRGPEAGGVPEVVRVEGARLTIGRKAVNDLVLPNTHVSGRHARIVREGDLFVLEDLDSVNGFAVDGRGRKRAALRGGEEIEIYPFAFRFEIEFEVDEAGGN